MRYLKSYKKFQENAVSTASSTAGMDAVSAAQPGSVAGTTGTTGSGDIGFTFKKEERKKGDPTEVSDMRDLEPAKGITHLKESEMIIRPRDPAYDPQTRSMINDCLIELYDSDFELTMMDYDKQRLSVDLDDEETGYFDQEELRISLYKKITKKWTGNITINCKFDESGITSKNVSTLRTRGNNLDETEQEIFDLVEEVALKLINNLEYQSGEFSIQWLSVNFDRRGSNNINLNVSFTLNNNLKS